MIDQPRSIRAGEELDLARLTDFLRTEGDSAGPVEVQQFPSGYSNLTYLVRWAGKEYVLRRPPFGANVKAGHDMEREFRVLLALWPIYPKVPRPVLYEGTGEVLGAPFYLMERVSGVILRAQPPKDAVLDEPTLQRLSKKLIDNLVDIHALNVELPPLAALGRPEGYVQRQVNGWIKRYQQARTDEIEGVDEVMTWLAANRPPEKYVAFLHNDYKYDNLVFSSDLQEIVAVLDWEMATVGDPLLDLGTALGYWIEATDPPALHLFGITARPGNLSRQELAHRYAEQSGRDLGNLPFYYAFGMFKIGVIVQQIYARYKKGLTQDERFAPLIHVLRASIRNAARALETGRISNW